MSRLAEHRGRGIRATCLPLIALLGCVGVSEAKTVKIVGVAATACADFNDQVAREPAAERDYVAWAQGFMSGLIVRAPAGVDEELDLLPSTFPLARQIEFLRAYCRDNPGRDYSDGVIDLYRLLRKPAS